jgi:large subunit ribosomal protein L25
MDVKKPACLKPGDLIQHCHGKIGRERNCRPSFANVRRITERNSYLHIDFRGLSLTEKIRATVNIELTGIAPAVKDFSGVVVEGLNSVEVEALPADLPERFIIDISVLKEIGDSIFVKDIPVSSKVEVLTPGDEMVILVTSPEAEEVTVEEGAEGAEPEVIEKGKKEEEE